MRHRSQRAVFAAGLAISLLVLVAGAAIAEGVTEIPEEPRLIVSQESGGQVRWIMPGPRRLDSEVFGTPDNPRNTNPDTGVPVGARATNEDGTAFTQTTVPTPFSDTTQRTQGSFSMRLVDRTPEDTPDSTDEASGEFTFASPGGENSYRVVLKQVIPVGPDHPFQGGVIISDIIHGDTGIGTAMEPEQYTYGAFWGVAELWINGEMVSGNRLLHVMTTERVRSEDGEYRLLFDHELPHHGAQTHVMIPDVEVTPNGPQESPVPSQFELPNGNTQPFIHVMFDSNTMEGLPLFQ